MPGPTIVLVHGGFVDGSGWRGVHDALAADGYPIRIVQNSTLSLAGDAAATRWVLDDVDTSAVLVGHSYGGAVISEAGTHAAVSALVYITAFVPDAGESVQTLAAHPVPGAPASPIMAPRDGFLIFDEAKFYDSYAAGLTPQDSRFLAASQVPCGVEAYASPVTDPAWRSKPSWYLVATDDRMIPPRLQRLMAERAGATTTEAPGSHAIYVVTPHVVADTIRAAAEAIA